MYFDPSRASHVLNRRRDDSKFSDGHKFSDGPIKKPRLRYRAISDSPVANRLDDRARSRIAMTADIRLRPIGPEPRPCKICGGAARLYGKVDFNRSCEELRGLK